MCFLKGVLGVERTTPNWAVTVLQECGQESLHFYWFRAAAKFCSLLCGNSVLLRKIVHADIALSASLQKKCWTVEFKKACDGLCASDRYTDSICKLRSAVPFPLRDFVIDLRERLPAVRRTIGWRR